MIFLPFFPFNLWPWADIWLIPPPSWVRPIIPPLTPVKPRTIKDIAEETFGDWIRFNWREPPQNPANVNAEQVPNELHPLQTTLVSTMQSINLLLPMLLIIPLLGSMMTLPILMLARE